MALGTLTTSVHILMRSKGWTLLADCHFLSPCLTRTSLTFSRTMLLCRSNAFTLANSFLLFRSEMRICVWLRTELWRTERGPWDIWNSSFSRICCSSSSELGVFRNSDMVDGGLDEVDAKDQRAVSTSSPKRPPRLEKHVISSAHRLNLRRSPVQRISAPSLLPPHTTDGNPWHHVGLNRLFSLRLLIRVCEDCGFPAAMARHFLCPASDCLGECLLFQADC